MGNKTESCLKKSHDLPRRDTFFAQPLPGSLPMLIDQIIVPCALDANPKDPNKYLADAVTCNANKGIAQLIHRSPVLADAVKNGNLKIIAGVQDLGSGEFSITQQ